MQAAKMAVVGLIILGTFSIAGGVFIGGESKYYIRAEQVNTSNDSIDNLKQVNYSDMESSTQRQFENAIRTNERVQISEPPQYQSPFVVDYNRSQYKVTLLVADVDRTRMFSLILGGIGMITVAGTVWYYLRVS